MVLASGRLWVTATPELLSGISRVGRLDSRSSAITTVTHAQEKGPSNRVAGPPGPGPAWPPFSLKFPALNCQGSWQCIIVPLCARTEG